MKNKTTVKHRPAPRILLLEVESNYVSAKYTYSDTVSGNIALRAQMKRLKENHIQLVKRNFREIFKKEEEEATKSIRWQRWTDKRKKTKEARKEKALAEIFKNSPLKVKIQILEPNKH